MKKAFWGIGISILVLMALVFVFTFFSGDSYEHQGYITEISLNEQGETVLLVIRGREQSLFVVKEYTRISAPRKQPFRVGDRVMLSTTLFSKQNLQSIKGSPGYSTEGRWIVSKGASEPLLLVTLEEERYLVSVKESEEFLGKDIKTGDRVRVYHATPLEFSLLSIEAEGMALLSEKEQAEWSSEDLLFLEAKGHGMQAQN